MKSHMNIPNLSIPTDIGNRVEPKPALPLDALRAEMELRKLLLRFKWADGRKMALVVDPLRRIDVIDAFKAAGLDLERHV